MQRTGYAFLTSDQTPGERRAHAAETIVVLEAGVIRLNPKQPLEMRLIELERSLEHLIAQHRPAVMAVEQLYAHYKHPRTAIIMGHARGVILALAARAGLNVIHVAATHVKKHLTGSGHASKAQIQRAIAATLRLPCIPEPNDVADALTVAFCGMRMMRSEHAGWVPPTTVAADPRVGCSPVAADPVMRSSSFAASDQDTPAGASSPLPSPKLHPNIPPSLKSKPRPAATTSTAADGENI